MKFFFYFTHTFRSAKELPAKSSFRNQSRNKFNDDDYDDDDDDDDYEDESVGGSNEDDEYDQMTYNSFSASTLGYKSVKFVEGRKSISSSGKKSQKDSAAVTHGPTSITLPYVLDVWDAKDASKHISLQIQLLSGMTEKSVYARVSSDKKAVVLTFPMSDYLAKADIALINYVGPLNPGSNGILEYHPKVIARAKSVSVIRNRDSTKVVTYEQRIPLPHECFHEWATEKSDPFFHGAHFVKYPDNSCHLHVEMIIDRGDKYMIEPEKLINRIIIGTNVHVPYENEEASHADDGNNTVFSMQGVQHYKADLESISSFRATLPGSIVAIPPVPDSPDSVKESPNGFHVTRSQKRQAIVLKKSGNPKSVA